MSTLLARWLDWLEKHSGEPPRERLASFNTLIERGCNSERMSYLGGVPLSLSDQQTKDVRRLNDDFRSIERVGLPRIILAAVDAIQHLMRQPQVAYKLEEAQSCDLDYSLASINNVLRS